MNERDDEGASSSGIAPADAAPHAPWPAWKRVLAYALLSGLSLASIYFVDRKVHLPAAMPVAVTLSLMPMDVLWPLSTVTV